MTNALLTLAEALGLFVAVVAMWELGKWLAWDRDRPAKKH